MDIDEQGGTDLQPTARAERRRNPQPLSYTGRRRDWDRLRDQCYEGLAASDETAVRRVFERLWLARVPLVDQVELLLAPTLHRIAEACETGTMSNARCRVAAGICERMLAWAVSCLDNPGLGAPLALVVTPRGEDHRLPALMAGAVLRQDGWAVSHVEDMAVTEVIDLSRRLPASVAVISFALSDLAREAQDLRDSLGGTSGVAVILGGPGQSLRRLQRQLGAVRAMSAGSSPL